MDECRSCQREFEPRPATHPTLSALRRPKRTGRTPERGVGSAFWLWYLYQDLQHTGETSRFNPDTAWPELQGFKTSRRSSLTGPNAHDVRDAGAKHHDAINLNHADA
ncbi:hypothetical protein EJ04DRAFT_301095 [Polyplosphaeria fusca]|uniref:Uncharacterized protein n=1 Tax=Polyplosphaeria fusca TaxID=682080 RepID=A0A9P4QUH2_9PLEO|nr:hypothetical protein EJ04DRAFT_301095 [Polyplosphaeria fusca]